MLNLFLALFLLASTAYLQSTVIATAPLNLETEENLIKAETLIIELYHRLYDPDFSFQSIKGIKKTIMQILQQYLTNDMKV